MKKIAFYSSHEIIDFEVITKVKFDDTKSYFYLSDLYLYLKSKSYELVNLESINSKDNIMFCIFIDTTNPVQILKKFNINIPKRILIQRECNVILPELWTKKTLDLYDAVISYNLKFCCSTGTKTKLIHNMMAQYINIKPKRYSKDKTLDFVMIASNKVKNHQNELYSYRNKLVNWFEAEHGKYLDLYGPNWDRVLIEKPKLLRFFSRNFRLPKKLNVHKGFAPHKLDTIANYNFCFCIENTKNFNGYISEKVFDAMMAGSIPIYYGPPDTKDHIPNNVFIDMKKFPSFEKLFNFCISMTLEEKAIYHESIIEFLENGSDQFSTRKLNSSIYKLLSYE